MVRNKLVQNLPTEVSIYFASLYIQAIKFYDIYFIAFEMKGLNYESLF